MQTLTVQITDKNALKELHSLEGKKFIRIVDDSDIDSPSMPGQAMSVRAFKNWINEAENAPAIPLKEAKAKWAAKRKQLKKITR